MLKDWFFGKVRTRALDSSTRELTAFVDGLKAMGDEDVGTLVAVATVIRVNFEDHGILPEGLFGDGPLPSAETLGRYQLEINRLARKFRKMGLATDAMVAMVWSYTLRCLNVPELRGQGVNIWRELGRGFPHVKKALKRGKDEKGESFPKRVWTEWNAVPAGFDSL